MTDEQMRIRLAYCAGFKDVEYRHGFDHDYVGYVDGQATTVPDYLNDLNAVHELEMKLDGVDQSTYEAHLLDVVTPEDEVDNEDRNFYWFVVHASANQRCEALLKTLGLWEDDDDK